MVRPLAEDPEYGTPPTGGHPAGPPFGPARTFHIYGLDPARALSTILATALAIRCNTRPDAGDVVRQATALEEHLRGSR